MARYLGSKSKISRKFGEPVLGASKSLEKKNYPPGIHGPAKRKKSLSEYGQQLKEKQKQNIHTAYWKDNLQKCITRRPVKKVLPVRTF